MGTILEDDEKPYSRAYAANLDEQDSLKHLRSEFIIPTKDDLKNKISAQTGKFYVFHKKFKHITSIAGPIGLLLACALIFLRFSRVKVNFD